MTLKMAFITTVFLASLTAFIMGLRRDKILKLDMETIKEAMEATGNEMAELGKKTMEVLVPSTSQNPEEPNESEADSNKESRKNLP
ncbi:uncharacterized protein Eint_020835 [Encephalitozoon intestinalis ATCC 50506]|uniref:Uncharacterized protein n=1 Tax=Encephalitozoon intestinalis (strain ATCC 50506) TaxID=876142 RepID=W8PGM2_ENCIT|nr:uncharacterized protein Eint_020835 [Encephalitozoon intestinalis ATCC 50506]AHL30081.1 hypothetical protein Eint_020835 [Encephalitozoon intestinalis ATCC 50506]UTX44735.1 hypothetical protein GPK93_02g02530 [Encephalitozoon intestinalis]